MIGLKSLFSGLHLFDGVVDFTLYDKFSNFKPVLDAFLIVCDLAGDYVRELLLAIPASLAKVSTKS
jgi:hypothetical protein